MKILYITKGDHVDYQNDCAIIGLKELFGSDVVDVHTSLHTYKSFDKNRVSSLYGKGMTVTRVIDDIDVDRTDIANKIINHFFDIVVYGSIWRCSDYFNEVLQYYKPYEIIIIDGEDETHLHPYVNQKVTYFKREYVNKKDNVFPISFAIPTNKLCSTEVTKTRDLAHIIPGVRHTYIYNEETDYYKGYQEAMFGMTCKKAGWDCMRHYEILGNRCIPLFRDIDHCPSLTMANFPKAICSDIMKKVLSKSFHPGVIYNEYAETLFDYTAKHLTTKALGEYIINNYNNLKNNT